jgi:galactokinase
MDLIATFTHHFRSQPELFARAPGRVNLLGEHIDYNEGMVLPVAIDRSVSLAAKAVNTDTVTVVALDLEQKVSFSLVELDEKIDSSGKPLPGWARYPAGIAWSLQQAGLSLKGVEVAFTSDVPIGSGLSSSAAVEVAFAVMWQALGGWQRDPLEIARLCQKAENAYVGVACGLMDQFASACGVAGQALYLDVRSLHWEPAPLPAGAAIVIADSGVRRSLSNSAYNERRAACEEAVSLLQKRLPHIKSLRDVPTPEFMAYASELPPLIRKRAEHVVKEIARVESALSALQRQDTRAFGALMYAGHASLRDLYEVSTPELDALVDIARAQPGCIGARLTGAGFGGCTVNLVEIEQAPNFIQGLQGTYQVKTGRSAKVYLCQASQGASASYGK